MGATLSTSSPLLTIPTKQPTLSITASSSPTKPVPKKPLPTAPVTQTPIPPAVTTPSATQAPLPAVSNDVNAKTRAALVNVLCTTAGGGPLNPISGTGVIIDPRGIVLTNAHIGQFFLLRDYPIKNGVDCILRTGSPAEATYTAKLLYFPQSWLDVNAAKIIQENPTGTGEHDFSLLFITGRTNPATSLPTSFPYVEPYVGDSISAGESVLLAAYPAGFLEGATIGSNLYISSAVTAIGQVFTFNEGGGADLISVGGTILSQKGSSGGAVVAQDTLMLKGLIVTATLADTTAGRDLRAITLRHINKSLIAETGSSLSSYLMGDMRAKADAFTLNVVPTMSRTLINILEQ